MDTTAQVIVSLMGTGGGGLVAVTLINGYAKWRSGASSRERVRNTDLITQRRQAVEERNEYQERAELADEKRREAEEHISILKRQLIEEGINPRERT